MATQDKQNQYSPQITPRLEVESTADEPESPAEAKQPQETTKEQEIPQETVDDSQKEATTAKLEEDSVQKGEVALQKTGNSDEEANPSQKVESSEIEELQPQITENSAEQETDAKQEEQEISMQEVDPEASVPEQNKLELPPVTSDAHTTGDSDRAEADGGESKEQIKLVLPSVAGLVLDPAKAEIGNDGLAESILLDAADDESDVELKLPRIDVSRSGKSFREAGLPTWNGGHEGTPVPMAQKPRREITAENNHPKCFGNVGAAGLSRVFTSGSFCPELSIRAMAPKVPSQDQPVENKASLPTFRDRTKPVERCRTIPEISRKKRDSFKMPEIRSTKVSLYSRDGERAKNLQFGPASSWNLDRSKTDLNASKSRLREKLQEEHKRPESESDELTPSESGEMGQKIHQWFKKERKKNLRNNVHGRNSKRSKNLWDVGIQSRIHRGLASSMLKPNESIGNYLNDVTSSRFPEVETRQIVSTKS